MSDEGEGEGDGRKTGRGGVFKMREVYKVLELVRDGWAEIAAIGVKARAGLAGLEIATDFTRLKAFFADLARVMEHEGGYDRRGDGDGASYLNKYKQMYDMFKGVKVFCGRAQQQRCPRTDALCRADSL